MNVGSEMGWTRSAHGGKRTYTVFCLENRKANIVEEPDIDGRAILQWSLENWLWNLTGFGLRRMWHLLKFRVTLILQREIGLISACWTYTMLLENNYHWIDSEVATPICYERCAVLWRQLIFGDDCSGDFILPEYSHLHCDWSHHAVTVW
jgi:hypothetical protein